MTLPAVSHQLLLQKGVELSNELHQFLCDTPNPTKNWNNKLLFLALLSYAVSLGKFSDLDRDDFMQLCEGFYDNLQVNNLRDVEES